MFSIIIHIALVCISLSMLGLVYRLIKGPSTPDRVVALDAMGINLIAIIALLSIILDTSAFLEAILLLAIVSFIGTTAFSKFLEKEDIIEHDRNL